jgi:uncharacterized protein (DUF983 family)
MSKLAAITEGKCPQCREGNIFEFPATNIMKFSRMHKNCPKCGLKFEREPGFFIGAMYVNYAFSIAIIISVGLTLNIFGIYNFYSFILTVLGAIILLLPILFRYSRILYLHMFGGVDYQPSDINQS